MITIIPSFTLRAPLSLLSSSNHTVGPFRAGMDAAVPLWLGTMLRRRKLARIVPPSWMDIDTLRRVLHYERDVRQANFSPDLPFRHAEMARAILSACGAGAGSGCSGGGGSGSAATAGFDTAGGEEGGIEIPNADAIKLLLEDIANVRMDKIRRNVHQLSSSVLTVRTRSEIVIDVTNIGSLEMHAITPYVLESFKLYRELSGRGSTYSKDVGELIPSSSSSSSSSNNNVSSSESSSSNSAINATSSSGTRGGRLQQSRLARESSQYVAPSPPPPPRGENETIEEKEEEELEIPRPMEEDIDEDAHEEDLRMADDDDEEEIDPPGDAAARGRSRLRRHR